jgi:antitoxin (DNA-binding transcriptional repressor) of toxin-antitoxin stability system
MTKISIEEAQAKLPELIHELPPGEELLITEDDQAVARLSSALAPGERKLGTLHGTVTYVAPDFDAPLDDFSAYMK